MAVLKQLETKNKVLELITTSLTRKEYLEKTVKLFKNLTNCACVGIRILDENGNIPYDAYSGFSKEFWKKENQISVRRDACACVRVITGTPEAQDKKAMTKFGSFFSNHSLDFVNNLSDLEKERFRGVCVASGFLSLAIIPIRHRRKILGAIHIADKKPGKISLETISLIEAVSPVIGEVIHRYNLENNLRKNLEIQNIINGFLKLSLKKMSLEDLLEAVLKSILSVPWLSLKSTGSIFLAKESSELLEMKAQKGMDPEFIQKCARVTFGECLCGLAAKTKKIQFSSNIDKRHIFTHLKMEDHGHYCVPIVSNEKILGVINIFLPANHQRSVQEEKFLSAIADSLAGIILRKKAEKALRFSNRALRVLSACNQAIAQARNEMNLLQEICRIIVQKGGYRLAWVGKIEQGKEKKIFPLAQEGYEEGYLENVKITWSAKDVRGRGPTGTAVREGRPVIGKDFNTDPKLKPWREQAMIRGYASSVALPIKFGRETLAVLTIYSSDTESFNKKEVNLLMELATDMAFGINTLRIKEKHRQIETEKAFTEEKLLESYKHLGSINCQISILLDLNKKSGGKNTFEIIEFIVNSAANLSRAQTVIVYEYDATKKYFSFLSGYGIKNRKSVPNIEIDDYSFLEVLTEKKIRIQGHFSPDMDEIIETKSKMNYFIFLPLISMGQVKGSIFLGFSDRDTITTQELDFYEAFAIQTSFVLERLNILR